MGLVMGFAIGAAFRVAAHHRALAEECISLVREEDDVGPLGPVKDAPQILFRFSNVLGYQGVEVQVMQTLSKAGSRG
jgi:hypothetical protein